MEGWGGTIALAGIALLAGCSPAVTTATGDADAVAKVEAGQVALVAVAPDGTNLWGVRPSGGRTIYFSSRGTQTSHSESCGKNCTRTIDDQVPMAGQ